MNLFFYFISTSFYNARKLFFIKISYCSVSVLPVKIGIAVIIGYICFIDSVQLSVIIGYNRASSSAFLCLVHLVSATTAHSLQCNANIITEIYFIINMETVKRRLQTVFAGTPLFGL